MLQIRMYIKCEDNRRLVEISEQKKLRQLPSSNAYNGLLIVKQLRHFFALDSRQWCHGHKWWWRFCENIDAIFSAEFFLTWPSTSINNRTLDSCSDLCGLLFMEIRVDLQAIGRAMIKRLILEGRKKHKCLKQGRKRKREGHVRWAHRSNGG